MKKLSSCLILLCLISHISWADEDAHLAMQRLKVLHSRLHEILSYRTIGLSRCSNRTHLSTLNTLISKIKVDVAKANQSHDGVIELLDDYGATLKFNDSCSNELTRAEAQLLKRQTHIFDGARNALLAACVGSGVLYDECVTRVMKVWSEVAPHCFSVYDADFTGSRESNACFAAENLLAEELFDFDPDQEAMAAFLAQASGLVNEAAKSSTIEWFDVSFDTGTDPDFGTAQKLPSQRRVFDLLAAFYTSGNSVLGYMDDYADMIWRRAMAQGRGAEATLDLYNKFRQKTDEFYYILRTSRQKNLKLTFHGTDVTQANHHTYISAFISCHYHEQGRAFAESLPYLLGAAYETKDFFANQKDGMPLQSATNKFQNDMKRYRQGAHLGFDLCK